MDRILYPVTALAFAKLQCGIFILAGEGSWLRIYDKSVACIVHSHRTFNDYAIHGITTFQPANTPEQHLTVLVWGGRSISVIQIESSHLSLGLTVNAIVPETHVDDWILDGCFVSPVHFRSPNQNVETHAIQAMLVSSHNVLFLLHMSFAPNENSAQKVSVHHLAAGPRSLLYSAQVASPRNGLGLVAAGTIYGEVLLWSYSADGNSSISSFSSPSTLHYIFNGHEGSVFGVRIFEYDNGELNPAQRILASCSDDRTIRLWDVSLLKDEKPCSSIQNNFGSCPQIDSGWASNDNNPEETLSMAMGHSSRIWDLRILRTKNSDPMVLSFGEDATTQFWRLNTKSICQPINKRSGPPKPFLLYQTRSQFHSKKNIWASAVYSDFENLHMVATGGADGRIACFNVQVKQEPSQVGNPVKLDINRLFQGAMHIDSSYFFSDPIKSERHAEAISEQLFAILEGKWKLFRKLQSLTSNYPSGTLEGTAVFEKRLPTSHEHDMEYLYTEEGQFITEQGVNMTARRCYAYRFQKETKLITAWFVKADNECTVDYLFHTLNFASAAEESLRAKEDKCMRSVSAVGRHLCINDNYEAKYHFKLEDSKCNEWTLEYVVKGPRKDYVSSSTYFRDTLTQPRKYDSSFAGTFVPSLGEGNLREYSQLHRLQSGKILLKNYIWINDEELLASAGATLLLGTLRRSGEEGDQRAIQDSSLMFSWKEIGQVDDLRHSCIFNSITSCGVVHFAGASGIIHCYRHDNKSMQDQLRVPRNVCYLNSHLLNHASTSIHFSKPGAMKIGIIAASIESRTSNVFLINMSSASADQLLPPVHLNHEHEFVVTSSCFALPEIVILGSRNGDLAVYNIRSVVADLNATFYFQNVHGNDSITSIKTLPTTSPKSDTIIQYILTTGRNGTFSVHQMTCDHTENRELLINFQTVHVGTPPFGPIIEGAHFNEKTKDLTIWGFRSKDFVVWNETQKTETMKVECGGAHRHWAYAPHESRNGGGSLVWTKASVSCMYLQYQASHEVLSRGGHGREIKAMAISPPIKSRDRLSQRLIATGAEDTAIRIFSARTSSEINSESDFKCLGIITKHTTGLQQLRWSSDGCRLFSAAGCEELYVWQIRSVPCIEVATMCESSCRAVTNSSDLRIMDFDILRAEGEKDADNDSGSYRCIIAMTYSDSSVRIFSYSSTNSKGKFEILSIGTYLTSCLTQAIRLPIGNKIELLTASTDGHIAIWPLTTATQSYDFTPISRSIFSPSSSHFQNAPSPPPTKIFHQTRIPIHQSSIKAMISLPLSPLSALLITGGDDGALALTLLTFPPNNPSSSPSSSILLIPKAHASAINAIALLHSPSPTRNPQNSIHLHFATASNDQLLKTWHLDIDLQRPGAEAFKVAKGKRVHSGVADVACLERFDDDDDDGGGGGGGGAGMEREERGEEEEEEEEEEGKGKIRRGHRGRGRGRVLVAGVGLESCVLGDE